MLESARAGAARSVNTAQVVANWMVGREIVEEEQQGEERAGYAERLVEMLSERLRVDYGAGYSMQNQRYMRQFCVTYPELTGEGGIRHAVRGELEKPQQNGPKAALEAVLRDLEREEEGLKIRHAVRGELKESPQKGHKTMVSGERGACGRRGGKHFPRSAWKI